LEQHAATWMVVMGAVSSPGAIRHLGQLSFPSHRDR